MRPMFSSKPAYTPVEAQRIFYNTGCLMDHPTGVYVRGMKGENILNGGLGVVTGVGGRPNTFKSTVATFMELSVAAKIAEAGIEPYMSDYDTEMNIQLSRKLGFSKKFNVFKDIDIIESGIWMITDTVKHIGNEWYLTLRNWLKKEKVDKAKDIILETPFIDKKGNAIRVMMPTLGAVDSLTKFKTSDVEELENKNQLGEGGGRMVYMNAGLAKARLLQELIVNCNAAAHYVILTVHVGADAPLQAGGMTVPPPKKLPHMKSGERFKGAPDDFYYLTNNLWQAVSATDAPVTNSVTKGPEFPRTQDDKEEGVKDLMLVTMKLVRTKSGPSGHTFDLIISLRDGVLPTLSEFYFIRENDRFGLSGNNVTYHLDLYPDVNIMRTTIRQLIDNDPLLVRAIKITADLLQIKKYYKDLPFEVPTPKELYEKLSKEYDWKTLLQTRDYWTFNQYTHPVPFLSTMDMIEMYHGLYVPFWHKSDKPKKG